MSIVYFSLDSCLNYKKQGKPKPTVDFCAMIMVEANRVAKAHKTEVMYLLISCVFNFNCLSVCSFCTRGKGNHHVDITQSFTQLH